VKKALTLVVLLLATSWVGASAQVIGPVLSKSSLELGYIYKWYHRDMEPNTPVEKDWEVASFFVRYGGTSRLTLSLEGGLWNVEHDDFPGMEFRRYTVGGGVGIRVLEVAGIGFSAFGHYNEVLDYDLSPPAFHKQTWGLNLGVLAEWSMTWKEQVLGIWGGPAYTLDESKNHAWNVRTFAYEDESATELGFVVGVNAVLWGRIVPSAHVVYADYFQGRIGIAGRWSPD